MFETITDLPDINPSDSVYRHQASSQLVKVRLLRLPIDPDATPEAQRNMRSFRLSAALCDPAGKALPDEDLGQLIAPAETLSVQMQGLIDRAAEHERSPAEQLQSEIGEVRLKLCNQAIQWQQLNALMAGFVTAN